MNIQEIWELLWGLFKAKVLDKPVNVLLLFIMILVIGIGLFFVSDQQKDYYVSVETTDSEIVKGLAVQYQLDGKGNYEYFVTETGGANTIYIFENTKTINFRLKDHKDYEDFNKTVDLDKDQDSYKIILVRRTTPITSSQQQTEKIKLKVRLVWSGTFQGIEGAELRFFDGASSLGNKKTSDIGYTEFDVPRKSGLTIQVKHPDLRQDGQMINVQDLSNVTDKTADVYKELSKK